MHLRDPAVEGFDELLRLFEPQSGPFTDQFDGIDLLAGARQPLDFAADRVGIHRRNYNPLHTQEDPCLSVAASFLRAQARSPYRPVPRSLPCSSRGAAAFFP